MGTGTDVIRQDIDALRDSMTDTIGEIEERVKGTVDTTVEKVKRTFDLRQQIQDQPFPAVGIAIVVGYMLGNMGGDSSSASMKRYSSPSSNAWRSTSGAHDTASSSSSYQASNKPGVIEQLNESFGDEINMLMSAGIAMGVGLLRDTIKQYIPGIQQEYQQILAQKEHQGEDKLQERAVGMGSHSSYSSSTTSYPSTSGSSYPSTQREDTPVSERFKS